MCFSYHLNLPFVRTDALCWFHNFQTYEARVINFLILKINENVKISQKTQQYFYENWISQKCIYFVK